MGARNDPMTPTHSSMRDVMRVYMDIHAYRCIFGLGLVLDFGRDKGRLEATEANDGGFFYLLNEQSREHSSPSIYLVYAYICGVGRMCG